MSTKLNQLLVYAYLQRGAMEAIAPATIEKMLAIPAEVRAEKLRELEAAGNRCHISRVQAAILKELPVADAPSTGP